MEQRTPVKEVIDGFLLDCKVTGKSPKTTAFYKEKLSKFLWFCDAYHFPDAIEEITSQHIKSFLGYLRDSEHRYNSNHPQANMPLSPNTIRKFYVALRSMLNWSIREGILEDSPLANIRPPKEHKHMVKALTSEQVQKILAQLNSRSFEHIRNKAIILVLVDTAIRLGELMNLTTESIDLDRQVLTVNGKTGERYVRIGNNATKALWRYLMIRNKLNGNCSNLWLDRYGNTLLDGAINLMLYDLGKKVGLKLHCHLFRHTGATLFLQNGGSPFQCQYILGHKTLEMTKIYCQALGFNEAYQAHMKASPADNLNSFGRKNGQLVR